jgi:hypothetical protein
MRGGGAPQGAILIFRRVSIVRKTLCSPGVRFSQQLAKSMRSAPPCRRSTQQRFLSPDRSDKPAMRRLSHALVPAMAAS